MSRKTSHSSNPSVVYKAADKHTNLLTIFIVRPTTKSLTMLQRTLLILALTASVSAAAEPEKLLKLRTSYEAAMTKAAAPIQRTYLQELEKLKIEYTKAGKLEDALTVSEELKKLAALASDNSGAGQTDRKTNEVKLSKKEREALEAAFQGKWEWTNNGGINVANSRIYSGSEAWPYEVKGDGTIHATKKNGETVVITLQPDHTSYKATDSNGQSWEGKHQP